MTDQFDPNEPPLVFVVGERFPAIVPIHEGFLYEASGFFHRVVISYDNLSDGEVAAFNEAPIRVGLVVKGRVLFFCFRIDGMLDWSDATLNIHRYPAEDRVVTDLPPGQHLPLAMLLLEGRTQVIRAIRYLSYSKHASQVVLAQMRRQLSEPLSVALEIAAVESVRARYPRPKDLVAEALFSDRMGLLH
jgi:hypothetical protein